MKVNKVTDKKMKNILPVIFFLVTTLMINAQQPVVVKIWPDGAPNSTGLTGEEQILENGRIANITVPTLTVYPAKNGNGTAVISCPGGAYIRLAMQHEGHDMAAWFNAQGITFAVLKYRMPNGHIEAPLSDAWQAIRIMRLHASEWGINPEKVGIMGFSAGGHLASAVATLYPSDQDRPDFQILFYPIIMMNKFSVANLAGKDASDDMIRKYSTDLQVTGNTPKAFLLCAADDRTVPCENSIRYFQALIANKVSATLHIYPAGGHGWGFMDTFIYKRQWTEELEKWLREINK